MFRDLIIARQVGIPLATQAAHGRGPKLTVVEVRGHPLEPRVRGSAEGHWQVGECLADAFRTTERLQMVDGATRARDRTRAVCVHCRLQFGCVEEESDRAKFHKP